MPFHVGENVGPYRITDELGQGGMATVYKAFHASLDRYVAIKVLHPSFKDDETFYARFQREAQIVAKLEHPHIVPIYDFASVGEEPYIVMKFVEGLTLKHRMKESPLTLEETLRILPAVASALTYAHQHGVLHRDVKPSNVLVDNDDVTYLTDFGLARIATRGESTMSQDVLLGTPNYISPEQARAEKNLGPGTDIYSLGIILYEIVVGRVPFSADTPYAVIHDHIYKPLPIPSLVNPTVPHEIERVLLKALSKDPEDRYKSADKLAEAFQEAVQVSNLNELSATSIKLENFKQATQDLGTASKEDLDQYIKASVAEHLKAVSPPPIPVPTATPTPYPIQSRIRRGRRSGRAVWVLSGIMALICICIASLAVTINAYRNPVVQNMPTTDAETEEPSPEPPDASQLNTDLTLAEAEAWAAEEPANPAAYLSLALLQLETGDGEAAEQNLRYAIAELRAPGALLAEAAAYAATNGYNEVAVILWFAAYHLAPGDAEIRNSAGQYIYRQMENINLEALTNLETFVSAYPDSAFVKTMIAHAILASSRDRLTQIRLDQVHSLLDEALLADDPLAEVHLVYGAYYAAGGDFDSARESWRFSASFPDSPEWVKREAIRLTQTLENQGD